jgi:ABC-type lipoprotein release transport system permease subunit
MIWVKLAWRNIWRNWRRSTLTILAIFFAAILTIISRSAQLGTYEKNITHTVEMFSGYIQIQKKGYLENPTFVKSFRLTQELKELLNNNQDIIGYAERIAGNGLISFKDNTFGIVLIGISPKQELKTSQLSKRIKSGKFLDEKNKNKIILGHKLLKNLQAHLGDTLVLLASGVDGTMGNLKFVIRGTYSLGSPDFDATSVIINLKAADDLLSMRGKIHLVALKLKNLNAIEAITNYLNTNLKNTGLVALGWEEVLPALKQSIELDNISGLIFQFLLMVVIAFGILNTVLMSINERYKEFGIMLAIGIKNSRLLFIVLIEVLFLIIIGIFIGNIVALSVNFYFYQHPIYISGDFAELFEQFGFLPAYYFSIDPDLYIDTSLRICIISLVTFIYPAYKLHKLEPLKGIRYT